MVSLVEPEPYKPKPLNGKQFSQMGLFAQPKPSAEHRWAAHGYSPERKAEMQSAVSKVSVTKFRDYNWSSKPTGGRFISAEESYPPRGPRREGKTEAQLERQGVANRKTQARAAIVDTLARTDIPPGRVQFAVPEWKVRPMKSGTGGHFRSSHRGAHEISIDPQRHGQQRTAHHEHAIVHELGHAVDFAQTGWPEWASRYSNQYRRVPVALEGYAEGFAAKHYKPQRNVKEQNYRETAAYTNVAHHPLFGMRFEEASGMTHSEAMAKGKQPSRWDPQPQHMGRQFQQQSLFHGPTPSEGKTVATWKGDKAEDYNVGSITVGNPKRR